MGGLQGIAKRRRVSRRPATTSPSSSSNRGRPSHHKQKRTTLNFKRVGRISQINGLRNKRTLRIFAHKTLPSPAITAKQQGKRSDPRAKEIPAREQSIGGSSTDKLRNQATISSLKRKRQKLQRPSTSKRKPQQSRRTITTSSQPRRGSSLDPKGEATSTPKGEQPRPRRGSAVLGSGATPERGSKSTKGKTQMHFGRDQAATVVCGRSVRRVRCARKLP